MPLILLAVLQAISVVTIGLLLLPFDWLSVLSIPTWLYLIGGLALLSWCLGD